jgi:hypothetical protein
VKLIRVAVAAVAVGITLTACSSPMEAGAAAVVGDQRISADDLTRNVVAYEAALKKANITPEQLGVPITQFVLFRLANQSRLQQLADKHGVQVSDAEIDTALKDPGQQQTPEINLLSKGVSPSDPRGYLRAEVGVNKLAAQFGNNQQAQTELTKELNAIPLKYSPRYGTFNQSAFVDGDRFGKAAAAPQPQQQPQD